MISATSSSIERVPSTRVTRQLNVCSHARSPCHRRQSDARDHRPADDQAVGAAIAAALSLSLSRVLLLCAIGSYTVANSPVAVLLAALFSVLGYAFKRLEPAPMILGFLLEPQMEDNVRRAMRVSSGDPMLFLEPPSVVATAVLLALIVLPAIRAGRADAFQKVG